MTVFIFIVIFFVLLAFGYNYTKKNMRTKRSAKLIGIAYDAGYYEVIETINNFSDKDALAPDWQKKVNLFFYTLSVRSFIDNYYLIVSEVSPQRMQEKSLQVDKEITVITDPLLEQKLESLSEGKTNFYKNYLKLQDHFVFHIKNYIAATAGIAELSKILVEQKILLAEFTKSLLHENSEETILESFKKECFPSFSKAFNVTTGTVTENMARYYIK